MIAGKQAHTFPDDCQQFAYRTVSYIGNDKQRFVSPGHFKDMKQLGRMENVCSRQRGMAFPLRYVLNLTGISNCKFIVFVYQSTF